MIQALQVSLTELNNTDDNSFNFVIRVNDILNKFIILTEIIFKNIIGVPKQLFCQMFQQQYSQVLIIGLFILNTCILFYIRDM